MLRWKNIYIKEFYNHWQLTVWLNWGAGCVAIRRTTQQDMACAHSRSFMALNRSNSFLKLWAKNHLQQGEGQNILRAGKENIIPVSKKVCLSSASQRNVKERRECTTQLHRGPAPRWRHIHWQWVAMVMTAEAEEVPKTAERTLLISIDHHDMSRINLSSSPAQKIKFVLDSRQPVENGRIFNLAVGLQQSITGEVSQLLKVMALASRLAGPDNVVPSLPGADSWLRKKKRRKNSGACS